MGSFNEHMSEAPGILLALLAGTIGFVLSGWMLAAGSAVAAYFVTHIGAAFPDIDHHSSIPYRRFKTIVKYVVGGVILYLLLDPVLELMREIWDNALSIINQGGYVFGLGQFYIALIITVGLILLLFMNIAGSLLDNIQPKHRGVTHKRGTGIIVSSFIGFIAFIILDAFIAQNSAMILGIIMGFANYVGVLSHLRLDDLLD